MDVRSNVGNVPSEDSFLAFCWLNCGKELKPAGVGNAHRSIRPGGFVSNGKEPVQRETISFGTGFIKRRTHMGRGILLWLLGVPIPIIILLAIFWH